MKLLSPLTIAGSMLATGLLTLALVVSADALVIDGPSTVNIDFQWLDTPVATPLQQSPFSADSRSASGTIATLAGQSLIIDSDSGQLVRVDRQGEVTGRLDVARYAAHLLVDGADRKVYVSDRMSDRIIVVDVRARLARQSTIATRAEPYGMALVASRADAPAMLLVTTVADGQLSAYSLPAGKELWSIELGPGPRGVTVSPDGRRAAVALVGSGAVARLTLRGAAPPLVRYTSINRVHAISTALSDFFGARADAVSQSAVTADVDSGRSFARAAFSARYLRGDVLVVGHQESVPHQATNREDTGVYGGGGGKSPVEHRLTFVADRANSVSHEGRVGQAAIGLHQPRAMTYDPAADRLYVAGYGSDEILALAQASTPGAYTAWRVSLGNGCGPNGLTVADGDRVLVYCALIRRLVTLTQDIEPGSAKKPAVTMGDELTHSRLSGVARRGRALFRKGGDAALSGFGLVACESCHPESRTDGLSWRIQGQNLQTPVLSGRIRGTAPFKWDGGDKTISQSLRNTVTRLGGHGISRQQASELQAFLESQPRPRTPRLSDPRAVARGRKLFHSNKTGCADCHSGALFTDRSSHDLAADLPRVDTPSLIGVSVSAPYYHDGSAATLRAVLLDNGSIHDMGNTEDLSGRDVDALIAYMRTL